MRALALGLFFLLATFSGCFDRDGDEPSQDDADVDPLGAAFFVNSVGENGPEPSIGIDSSGAIYFQAMEKTMKSTDGGRTWANVNGQLALPATLDPYLWLDPVTDRVFANQLYVACSYLTFTDDGGASWTSNPAACGTPSTTTRR